MNEKIQSLWKNFIEEYKKAHPGDVSKLNLPAVEDDFLKFKTETEMELPEELKAIYELNNGQSGGVGIFFGLEFLPIDGVIKQWKVWDRINKQEKDGSLKNMNSFCTSYPAEAIKIAYTDSMWIPFTYDYGGNHIGVDLDPDTAGKVGQIINFGADEDGKVVLAENLQIFLERILSIYQTEGLDKKIEGTNLVDYLKKEIVKN